METLLTLAWLALFLFLISRMGFFKTAGLPVTYFQAAYLFKFLCGVALTLVYTYYYPKRIDADTFKYFDDSQVLFSALPESPSAFFQMLTGLRGDSPALQKYYTQMNWWYKPYTYYNDNCTLIRLNALLRVFSTGSYYVHLACFNFLSLLGLTSLYKLFVHEVLSGKKILFIAVFFFPSVAFWSAGLSKDSLQIFALGMFVYSFRKFFLRRSFSFRLAMTLFVSLTLLLTVKIYTLAIMIPSLAAYAWTSAYPSKSFVKFLTCHVVYLMLILWPLKSITGVDLLAQLAGKQKEFLHAAEASLAGSVIQAAPLQPVLSDMILHLPQAWVNVLFRPHLFEATSPAMLIAAVENALLAFGLVCALFFFFKKRERPSPLFLLSLFFVTGMFTLIGLVTPILGAIVRYKIVALPFLLFLFIQLINKKNSVPAH